MKKLTNAKQHAIKLMLLVMALVMSSFSARALTVKGQVTDATGEPLVGASVTVKGVQGGAVTDIDGNYTLANVDPDATMVFSYIS